MTVAATTTSDRVKLSPRQQALALLLKEFHRDDDACQRAVDNLLKKQDLPPLISFDGVEARFQSESEPELENVVTAEGCSCRGGRHPWCVHRIRFRILLAEAAILDPLGLLSSFLEQVPESMRRPRPYLWPVPEVPPPRILEEALPNILPNGLLPPMPNHSEPPPHNEADRRSAPPAARPRSTIAPLDPRVQAEIGDHDSHYR